MCAILILTPLTRASIALFNEAPAYRSIMVTILHISDLHRDDPALTISNDVLLNSLEKDRNRYTQSEQPLISAPNLIIASGDIVQGVKGSTDTTEALIKQYEEAESFLSGLANTFLNGDKSRVIIVPGNHDVSDYIFKQSLEKLKMVAETEELSKKKSC
jgi:3',5'-cyclic AMP phosphodiesterase CpdA